MPKPFEEVAMTLSLHDLSVRLSAHAESVCAHYLSNGRRHGRYWLVGDVFNTPGRSMYVRLAGPSSGAGAAGKWTDAATGEHGDLVDLIRMNRGYLSFRALREEILCFLAEPVHLARPAQVAALRNSAAAARRLFMASRPLTGTLGEAYLRARGITVSMGFPSLRFHPGCYYRDNDRAELQRLPAIIAAVTDLRGEVKGVSRTYLDPHAPRKALVRNPRMAMGNLLGQGVRFGEAHDVLVAGEGVETLLTLKALLPQLPMVAALSANHLAALLLPRGLRRLYIAHDNDRAGLSAAKRLVNRLLQSNTEVRLLTPVDDDWNTDWCRMRTDIVARLRALLHDSDRPSVPAPCKEGPG